MSVHQTKLYSIKWSAAFPLCMLKANNITKFQNVAMKILLCVTLNSYFQGYKIYSTSDHMMLYDMVKYWLK